MIYESFMTVFWYNFVLTCIYKKRCRVSKTQHPDKNPYKHHYMQGRFSNRQALRLRRRLVGEGLVVADFTIDGRRRRLEQACAALEFGFLVCFLLVLDSFF
ncbi:MAG: hypothetical protein MJY99_08325 [Fibrobacter sp.]|nr:hypothetical protein [Fibrobacter sp.]